MSGALGASGFGDTESPPRGPGTLSGNHRRVTEERILDAAERCMARLGLQRFSMGAVARSAGVSRGSVYSYFGDRASLVDAVLSRVASRFVASSEPVVRRRRALADQVAEAAVFIRQHLGDQVLTLSLPGEQENLVATLLTVQIERLVGEWVAFWLPLLAEAEQRGEIRRLHRRQGGEWIVRLLLSFAVMPAVSFDLDDPAAIRSFVRAHVVKGLGP